MWILPFTKGTVLVECGRMLSKNDYRIKVLNTINFAKSMHYNPFAYIRSEKDILKLVNTIIVNTKGEGQQASEDFWVKAEKLYYTALIAYIWYEAPEEEQNFSMLIDLVDASEAREDDENFKNAVDLLFEELEQKNPNHFAVRQYKKYKLAAGKTAKSNLISCGARLASFDIKELRDLTAYDELELDTLGEKDSTVYSPRKSQSTSLSGCEFSGVGKDTLIWGSLCAMPAVSPERKSGNACFRRFSTASTICLTKSSSRSLVSR